MAHQPEPSAAVDLQLKIQYSQSDMQQEGYVPTVRQRLFSINLIGTNRTKNTLRKYDFDFSIPKPIVLYNNQTGKRIDQQTDPNAIFQFPISQENPLPDLTPGRELSMTQVLCLVSERLLEHRPSVVSGEIKVTLYCDGIAPVIRVFPLKEIDPFKLMDILYDSRKPNAVYELEPIGQE